MATTAQKTTIDRGLLEIHVLGAGKGESIVVHCPNGAWGVVDCYSPSLTDPDANPTLRLLNDSGVSELDFLCLTHPHDDHYCGMSQLLQSFPVRHFWRFSGLSARDLVRLTKYFKVDAERSGSDELIERANDFAHLMALVNERWRSKQTMHKRAGGCQQLYPVPADASTPFQIWSFAPSGNQVQKYEDALTACFAGDDLVLDRARLAHADHNGVSVGLFLEYGKTRVILGGDVEGPSWEDACVEFAAERMSADAVKVSHHGSSTGYIEGLWERFAQRKKPIAVIVPYRRFRLPQDEAIDHIRPHAETVLLTCPLGLVSGTTSGDIPSPVKSRAAIHARFHARPAPAVATCGRWTLVFDADGNCVRRECIPPAHEL